MMFNISHCNKRLLEDMKVIKLYIIDTYWLVRTITKLPIWDLKIDTNNFLTDCRTAKVMLACIKVKCWKLLYPMMDFQCSKQAKKLFSQY